MKTLKTLPVTFLAFALSVQISSGQERDYEGAMRNTITMMNSVSGIEETVRCANIFERIGKVEKDRWLPFYYGGYALIVLSYDVQDPEERDKILDMAQLYLDTALGRAPDESEIHVLQAFLYPSRILVDPTARGMIYMEKIFNSLETSKKLNPDNPRIYFMEGVNLLNLPPSFGGGAEVARPVLEMAAQKFDAFQTDDPLWPAWGEEETRMELEKLERTGQQENEQATD